MFVLHHGMIMLLVSKMGTDGELPLRHAMVSPSECRVTTLDQS